MRQTRVIRIAGTGKCRPGYERGVHSPDLEIAERLAKVLRVPAPFFYAADGNLAAWILAFSKVSSAVRKENCAKRWIN
jgi:transcriptional regulator with XRE-family HTH domain